MAAGWPNFQIVEQVFDGRNEAYRATVVEIGFAAGQIAPQSVERDAAGFVVIDSGDVTSVDVFVEDGGLHIPAFAGDGADFISEGVFAALRGGVDEENGAVLCILRKMVQHAESGRDARTRTE